MMEPNNFITDPKLREQWNTYPKEQQERLNKAMKRASIAESNFERYLSSSKPPAVIVNKRDRRLWPQMDKKMRKLALLGIRDHALMAANMAGAITGETN